MVKALALTLCLLTASAQAEVCLDLLNPPQLVEGVIPNFAQIRIADLSGILEQRATQLEQTKQTILSVKTPTFENVILPLEWAFESVSRVGVYLDWQMSTDSTPELEEANEVLSARMIGMNSSIYGNAEVFKKIKYLHTHKKGMTAAQQRLVDSYYSAFVGGGAELSPADFERFQEYRLTLQKLSDQYSANVKASTAKFKYVVKDAQDLKGISSTTLESLKIEDGYLLTLRGDLAIEIMERCQNPKIRRLIYEARRHIGTQGDEFDNTQIVKDIARIRQELAELMGYKRYADMVVEGRMAGSLQRVYDFYYKEIAETLPKARAEYAQLLEFVKAETGSPRLEPWDVAFYQNLLSERKLSLDMNEVKKYFTLDRSLNVALSVLNRLFGWTFIARPDLPKAHADNLNYEVKDRSGKTISFLQLDLFARTGTKSGGAWMSGLSGPLRQPDGSSSPSFVGVAMNISKDPNSSVTLLEFDQVITLLHELGHATQHIASRAEYPSQYGTSVLWDSVEMASQFLENYFEVPEVLDQLAIHFETGKQMPAKDKDRLLALNRFWQALGTLRQIRLGLIDMAWHTGNWPHADESLEDFEDRVGAAVNVIPNRLPAVMSGQFTHIMSGGYAAGYYSYLWALNGLAKPLFAAFQKAGVFNAEMARRYEENILATGNSIHPQEAFDKTINEHAP